MRKKVENMDVGKEESQLSTDRGAWGTGYNRRGTNVVIRRREANLVSPPQGGSRLAESRCASDERHEQLMAWMSTTTIVVVVAVIAGNTGCNADFLPGRTGSERTGRISGATFNNR